MDGIFKRKVIAITLGTVALTGTVVLESGADTELPALAYEEFLNRYTIEQNNDSYDVKKNVNHSITTVETTETYEEAENYINQTATKEYEYHKSFGDDFRMMYIGGIAGVSALTNACFINAIVPPEKKRKRR